MCYCLHDIEKKQNIKLPEKIQEVVSVTVYLEEI